MERSIGLGPGDAEFVDAAVGVIVMWLSERVGKACNVSLLLWLAVVNTLLEVDETVEGSNRKPGLVLVVIASGSV